MKRIAKLAAAALVLALGLGGAAVGHAQPTDAQKDEVRAKLKAQHDKDVEAQKQKVQEQHQKDVEAARQKAQAQHTQDVQSGKAKIQDQQQKKLDEMKSGAPAQ